MLKHYFAALAASIALAVYASPATAQQIAFPGAEGFGKYAEGGRKGAVYHVTNLADSGAGSFRDAVSQPQRTVVFDVSGIIRIQSRVTVKDHITIAGQTAPGEGIVVYGNSVSFSEADNVIVRYIRFRGGIGMSRGACTLIADNAHDLIFDHVSIEWGRWDNLHIKNSRDITLSYCLIGEGIDPQRFGALLEGPVDLTIHHCLWIDNQSRNPKGKAKMEFINNVVYNWGSNGFVGGHSAADHFQDLIGNYFIAGPHSSGKFIGLFTATDHVFATGNFLDLTKDGKLNGHAVGEDAFTQAGASAATARQDSSCGIMQSAPDAYQNVLRQAGASLHRDAVDRRITGYLASLGKEGTIFHNEQEAGGQPPLRAGKAPKDRDRDGMPDRWEKSHRLHVRDPSDAAVIQADGYTHLEAYLHSLVR